MKADKSRDSSPNPKNHKAVVIAVLSTLIGLVAYFITRDATIFFCINVVLTVLILAKAKLSFFSIKTLVVNYIQSPLIMQHFTGTSYGLLQVDNAAKAHYELFLISIFIYNIVWYLLLSYTNILQKEKLHYQSDFYIKGKMKYILVLIAIASIIIGFPQIPFLESGGARFQALLPGNGWNHVSLIALIMLMGNLWRDKSVLVAYVFCIGWLLLHYERVDAIGLIALVLIVYVVRKKIEFNLRNTIKAGLVLATVFVGFVMVGNLRAGGHGFNIGSVLSQSTASDIAYVYGISIDYKESRESLNGRTYLTYLTELIPLTKSEDSVEAVLRRTYQYPGGEYILSAVMMNFGLFMIPVFAIIEFLVIYLIMSIKGKIAHFYILFIGATIFRSNWYGLRYIETGMVYIIPVLYALSYKYIEVISPEKSLKKNFNKLTNSTR